MFRHTTRLKQNKAQQEKRLLTLSSILSYSPQTKTYNKIHEKIITTQLLFGSITFPKFP